MTCQIRLLKLVSHKACPAYSQRRLCPTNISISSRICCLAKMPSQGEHLAWLIFMLRHHAAIHARKHPLQSMYKQWARLHLAASRYMQGAWRSPSGLWYTDGDACAATHAAVPCHTSQLLNWGQTCAA